MSMMSSLDISLRGLEATLRQCTLLPRAASYVTGASFECLLCLVPAGIHSPSVFVKTSKSGNRDLNVTICCHSLPSMMKGCADFERQSTCFLMLSRNRIGAAQADVVQRQSAASSSTSSRFDLAPRRTVSLRSNTNNRVSSSRSGSSARASSIGHRRGCRSAAPAAERPRRSGRPSTGAAIVGRTARSGA